MTNREESSQLEPMSAVLDSAPSRRLALPKTFTALRHRNYRLYFFGQLVSFTGTWMQNVAQSWLVYDLTQSPLYLGIVGFSASIPVLAFSLGAGVYVDRVPKRWLMLRTQTAAMVLAFILSADVFLGWVQPWHIIILAFSLGVVNTFDNPARQSFMIEMVGREDLSNAIALQSTLFNSARIFGPTLAGILLALVGPAWCFFLNGASFIAVIVALTMMTTLEQPITIKKESALAQVREGLGFIRNSQVVRTLLAMVAVSNIFAFGYQSLMPAFARDVLGVGPVGLGFMSAAIGVGAVTGALTVASVGKSIRKGRMLTLGNLLFPSCVLLFALSRFYPLSLGILFLAGLGFMMQGNLSNTLIQTSIPDHLRGRVMSVFTLVMMGFFPISSLIAGTVAQNTTIPIGAMFGSSIALAFSLFWLWRAPYVRELP